MAKFQCYGENGFTFLFFQALHRERALRGQLLSSLLQFGTGDPFQDIPTGDDEGEVWLFPHFGKFGSPDAIVLIEGRSFWIEVETRIRLLHASTLNKTLLQLARFHYLHHALSAGTIVSNGHGARRVVRGLTIQNNGAVKRADVRVKGHPVLQRMRKKLMASESHFVLLTQGKPRGLGGDDDFGHRLGAMMRLHQQGCDAAFGIWNEAQAVRCTLPPMLPVDRCWYSYWNGHIQGKWSGAGLSDPLIPGGYVSIRN